MSQKVQELGNAIHQMQHYHKVKKPEREFSNYCCIFRNVKKKVALSSSFKFWTLLNAELFWITSSLTWHFKRLSEVSEGLLCREKVRPTIPVDVPLPKASAHDRWGPAWGVVAPVAAVLLVPELSGESVVALALHQAGTHAGPGVVVAKLVARTEAQLSQGGQARH